MRVLDFLTFLSGVVLLLSAGYRARRGEDMVEVIALVLVGLAVTILGADEISREVIPRWIEAVATILLLLGGTLFLGLPKYRKRV